MAAPTRPGQRGRRGFGSKRGREPAMGEDGREGAAV